MKTAKITKSYERTKFGYRALYTVNFGEVLPSIGQDTAVGYNLKWAKGVCKKYGFIPEYQDPSAVEVVYMEV